MIVHIKPIQYNEPVQAQKLSCIVYRLCKRTVWAPYKTHDTYATNIYPIRSSMKSGRRYTKADLRKLIRTILQHMQHVYKHLYKHLQNTWTNDSKKIQPIYIYIWYKPRRTYAKPIQPWWRINTNIVSPHFDLDRGFQTWMQESRSDIVWRIRCWGLGVFIWI